jgi:hydrogenase maturation protein HypF
MGGELAREPPAIACRWILTGQVQGVGFRPFIYRLAHRYGLKGWVRNETGQVEIVAEGEANALALFAREMVTKAPLLAKPIVHLAESSFSPRCRSFEIVRSEQGSERRVYVPPDYFTCDDCLKELADPADRRYRYPFINCTQCGPRYTLIHRLPYDRPNTSMEGFALCGSCRREYASPLDRRFHAEPIACADCGPTLNLYDHLGQAVGQGAGALNACVAALRAGAIVAVKGIGGFHLMCDARNPDAVAGLRSRKPRPHKPLAILFPMAGDDGLGAVREAALVRPEEAECLRSPVRPIVLLTRKNNSSLPAILAPGLREIGALLPYSPLHQLLLKDVSAPLVATSANLTGEPVLTDGSEVRSRLGHVVSMILDHDRPIVRPADDPLFRVIGGRARPLRLGRGCAPRELSLPFSLPAPLLAVGAHMKTTIALGWQDRVVVSPHIGDLGTPRSLKVFQQVVADLQALYGVEARQIVCDAHPDYATSRWAEATDLPVRKVFHHHAHAAALSGEYPECGPWLVFTWDGVGFGADGTFWGGEALLGRPGVWRRVATLRSFRLPGGERAAREPWRSAASLCWETGVPWLESPAESAILRRAWQRRLNAPLTSAAGRLFDAAAALTGLLQKATYEGEGPMRLEAVCEGDAPLIRLPLMTRSDGIWRVDWAPLVPFLLDAALPVGTRAFGFHRSLAYAVLELALRVRKSQEVKYVGLSGGVFQNRVLTEETVSLLESHGFEVRLAMRVPVNDAGISFGQIVEAGSVGHPGMHRSAAVS